MPVKKAAVKSTSAAAKRKQRDELTALLLSAIRANTKDDKADGWVTLGGVGSYVVNTMPTFDSRNYGYPRLSALVRDLPGIEVRESPTSDGNTALQVRAAPPVARKRR